jgi:hypothetical protein
VRKYDGRELGWGGALFKMWEDLKSKIDSHRLDEDSILLWVINMGDTTALPLIRNYIHHHIETIHTIDGKYYFPYIIRIIIINLSS